MSAVPKSPSAVGSVARAAPGWLQGQRPEAIIDPGRPIVDAHHHLWHRRGWRYGLAELAVDTGSGHHVTHTVFIDCMAGYRTDGPPALQPVGETEFAAGVADQAASGAFGPTRACAAIVSHADLTLGAAVQDVLQAHIVAGRGRFRGIRHVGAWDASEFIHNGHTHPPPGLYADARFREGFAQLAPLGLSFEAWQYHPQLGDVLALARAFPDTTIVLNHVGGPLGVGPYAGRADAVFSDWRRGVADLAACANVCVKLGGLGMPIGPFDFHRRERPPTSRELADAWRPWITNCIEAFGARRCMFESNFPVDQASTGYAVLWNAFKRLAAGAGEDDKTALFSGTATRVYKL
jgi:predicted TIM-barrel fold metal-dependent hydrolase